jgi:hypothetical protein
MISQISKSRNKHPDNNIVFKTDECKKKTFVKSPANIMSLKSYLNAPKSLFSMAKFDKFKIPQPRTESNSKSKDSNNRSGLRSSVSKSQSKSKSKPKQTMLNNYTKKVNIKMTNAMSTSLDYKKISQKNNIGNIKTLKTSFVQPKKIMDFTYNTKKREEVFTDENNIGDNIIREVKSNLDDNYKHLFNFSYDMFLKDPESTRNEI